VDDPVCVAGNERVMRYHDHGLPQIAVQGLEQFHKNLGWPSGNGGRGARPLPQDYT
jgi:hypothetical protein